MTTTGEYRVGIDFNPSGDDTVGRIKRAAADLIDLIEEIEEYPAQLDHRFSEIRHAKQRAMREVESAAMWAVKAATKPLPK